MRLWVCCGHGDGDSGAVGGGYTEAERVRVLGARIAELGGDAVVLMDPSRNWYASRGFDSVSVPSGDAVVELHMDSSSASARGAHVIYKAGFVPDAYDVALADFVSGLFPGRAVRLSGRADLRNCNVCARRGINYRLVENGFISNASDRAIFNANVDVLARGYLAAFGIRPVDEEGNDMTDEQSKKLDAVYNFVTRTDDPTGRGVNMDIYTHLKYVAQAVQACVQRIAELEELISVDADGAAD